MTAVFAAAALIGGALLASLSVNLDAVLGAFDEPRSEGLLDVRRGRGVVGDRTHLVDLARSLVAEGARHGLGLEDLRKLLEEVS